LSDEEYAKKLKELGQIVSVPSAPATLIVQGQTREMYSASREKWWLHDHGDGCLCPTCPLAQKYEIGVMYNFYCQRGTETEQKEG
jgi:hypothetical protein